MVRFVLSLFWVAVLGSFVSAAVEVPQLQDNSVCFHIWPHLNLDINLNSYNPSVSSYLVLLLLQWYQLLTRPGVWIASPAPPATSSSHWSKSVFVFWTTWVRHLPLRQSISLEELGASASLKANVHFLCGNRCLKFHWFLHWKGADTQHPLWYIFIH